MHHLFTVAGRKFRWTISETAEFPALLKPYPSPDFIDVLRIDDVESDFDVALRVDRQKGSQDTLIVVLGPILVLGSAFPNATTPVAKGSRIRLRPKISIVNGPEVTGAAVERIVSWCLSPTFRPVPCDRHGLPQQQVSTSG